MPETNQNNQFFLVSDHLIQVVWELTNNKAGKCERLFIKEQ